MSSLKRTNDLTAAVGRAVRYAQRGVRSIHEVTAYLRRSGLATQQAQSVIHELSQKGLVNDRVCARLWAEHWARKGFAWSAIRSKLSGKGLDDQVIEAVRQEGDLSATDLQRAAVLIAQWQSKRHVSLAKPVLSRRLAAYGFDEELISRLLEYSSDERSS